MNTIESNGARIPALGFGTYRMTAAEVAQTLPAALQLGFRHVDAAQIYGNEDAVGDALRSSGVARDDIFLTTKVWVTNFAPDRFEVSVIDSLRQLGTDHVDLLLLHWPQSSDVPRATQLELLNAMKEKGLTRHIGVSNYNTALMREATELSDAPLVNNQVEYHPWLDQSAVIAQAKPLGMSVTGYFAMANGRTPTDPLLQDIGAKYGRSAAQVVLRWMTQQDGVAALSKTARPERLKENFDIFDFSLADEDMAAIGAMAAPDGRIVLEPELAPAWD
ncbi:aldo/keto reductase [Novosphingobium sp.]|uniref:aldo/keto reductase n=1 Tax=Novosphingobium sp. TaxID=1874826 RepID=UPI0028A5CF73|nr:aldo/keto reductase [Novosphingobium sp.]